MTEEPRTQEPVPAEEAEQAAVSDEDAAAETEAVLEPSELELVTRQRDDYLDALRRLKAEFDNFRKRALREQQSLVERAAERLVRELLPVLDDLERALQAAEQHPSRSDVAEGDGSAPDRLRQAYAYEAKLEDGVQLVHRSFADVLRKEGLEEIETDGRFDPHVHEALLSQPSEADEGSVIQVIQKGYRLGDRVLRPARVVVAAPMPAAPEPQEGEQDRSDG